MAGEGEGGGNLGIGGVESMQYATAVSSGSMHRKCGKNIMKFF